MSAVTESKIEVRHVFKVFGNREKEVLALIRAGKSKDQVLAETGCVVGINDLSLSIQAGRSSSSWVCPGRASRRWFAT